MLIEINRNDLVRENPESSKENAVEKQKEKLTLAIAQLDEAKGNLKEAKLKPNPIVMRNGEQMIVLRFSQFPIKGFPLKKNDPKEAFLYLRDTWLEEDKNQELVWEVYQEMCEELALRKNGESKEEVVH